jgi:hypothetical protein
MAPAIHEGFEGQTAVIFMVFVLIDARIFFRICLGIHSLSWRNKEVRRTKAVYCLRITFFL